MAAAKLLLNVDEGTQKEKLMLGFCLSSGCQNKTEVNVEGK